MHHHLKYLMVIITSLLGSLGLTQIKISGTVIDASNNKPIPYADITLPNANVFTSSNSDGSFYLESQENDSIIEVSANGYEFFETYLTSKVNYNFLIKLNKDQVLREDTEVELQGAIITKKRKVYKRKKENPAYAILNEIWKRKKKNGLKNVPHYQYEEYEKIQFDINNIDSTLTNRKIFDKLEFIFERIDTSEVTGKAYLPAFINESIYKVYGQNQPTKRERKDLIANKSSGFSDNEIVSQTLKNLYKEFDIYENRINFFDKNFVSPIARDGFSVYEYELNDTVNIDGIDCYRIKYYPKRKGEFTFLGDFYVSTNSFAIKEISMQSTKNIDVNFVRDIFVNLQFDVKDDSIFYPTREYILLDLSLINKKSSAKGLFAHRTISYKNFDFTQPQTIDFLSQRKNYLRTEEIYNKSDDFWDKARHERLSKTEGGIYEMLDSLQQVPKFKRIVKGIEIIGSGYWNVGKSIDIGDLYSTFGYNKVEGLRLRSGARTYFSQNDMWRVAGYLAYGFRDHQFKYGAEARYMFNPYNRFQIGIGTKRDIEQLGVQLTSSDGIMTRSFASSSIISQGENNKLSHINKTNVYTSIEPWKNFIIRLDGNYQTIRSADPALFNIGFLKNGVREEQLTDTNLSLSFIARPGAKYSQHGIDRYEHSTLAPTIMLRYTKGLAGVFDSEFEYDKLQFIFSKPFLIGSLGKSLITFEAGKTFQGLPLSLLSIIPGNESYGQVPGTFTQLDYYEFVTDSYSTFILDHHFNGWVFNRIPLIKKLKIREVGFVRTAWGNISKESLEINDSEIDYLAPKDKIYVEYGFGIENIGLGNFRPFRVDFNWRGNYLDNPNARKFGVTVGMDMTF